MSHIGKLLMCIMLCLFSLVFFYNFAIAESDIVLEISDPIDDDYGPGTYQYPGNEEFMGEGLFDIRSFSIKDLGDQYQFNFLFSNLIDPWNSKYGFSLPLIELYFGKKGEGFSELFTEGANINLDPRYPWSRMLKISGWWVRVYRPEDKLNEEDDFWDVENNPADIKDVEVDVKGNYINIIIEKDIIGDLNNGHVYVLVGSYDPFGPDHFRDIKNEPSSWYFSSSNNVNLEYAPRVIDIILPDNLQQKEVLSDYLEDYPTIVPISINNQNKGILYLPAMLIILILLVMGLFIMNKKNPLTNNKE